MPTKTRTVTRYRSRPAARRRSGGRSRLFGSSKISLAIIAGLYPAINFAFIQESPNPQTRFFRLIAAFTGYSPYEKKFTSGYLQYGLWPLAGGFLAHMLADRFGVNRAIGKFGLPIEI